MAKGTGPVIQTILLLVAVVGYSVLVVMFMIVTSGREVAILAEETKLATINNVFNDIKISFTEYWKIAGAQALHSLEKESEEWNWKEGVDYSFVESRINAALTQNYPPASTDQNKLTINRADVEISGFTAGAQLDEKVTINARQHVWIKFFEAEINMQLETVSAIDAPLAKLVDEGNELGKIQEKFDSGFIEIPQYTQDSDIITYMNAVNAPLSPLSEYIESLPAEREKILSLEAAQGRAGLALKYVIKAAFTSDEMFAYYDGTALIRKKISLPVKVEGENIILDCPQNEGLIFRLLRPKDALCYSGQIYTCGTDLSGTSLEPGQTTGPYACMLTQAPIVGTTYAFCSADEKNSNQQCCSAFGGTFTEDDEGTRCSA